MSNENPLNQVITLSEASKMWKKDRKAIIYQYWYGYLQMRKSAGVWLVSLHSMYLVYGEPTERLLPYVG